MGRKQVVNARMRPCLLFDGDEIEAIRAKIAKYEWARKLYEKLMAAVYGTGPDPYLVRRVRPKTDDELRFTMTWPEADISAFPDEGMDRGVGRLHSRRFLEMALLGQIAQDPKILKRVRDLLPVVAEVLMRSGDVSQWPQAVSWVTGWSAAEILTAYDLAYNEPSWTDGDRDKVEGAFRDVMERILAEPSARHLCNATFNYQVYKVVCGCFFGRQDWINEGLRGRAGFFDALREPAPKDDLDAMRWYINDGPFSPHHRVQLLGRGTSDGMLWYENGGYGPCAVLKNLCVIAEAMRHYGGADLWNYVAPGGASLHNIFKGLLIRCFPDGVMAWFGANGTGSCRYPGFNTPNRLAKTVSRPPIYPDGPQPQSAGGFLKWDLASARYDDPELNWAAVQNPERSDGDYLGYCALWYGRDASEMEISPPDVRSHTFKRFGSAMVRSTEGPEFWESETPMIAVHWGGDKYRCHPDQFGFILWANGHAVEPDLGNPWDYSVPQGGRNLTPLSASSYVHNVVVVDGRNHGKAAADLVVDDYGPHIKVLGLAGDKIDGGDELTGADLGRWIGVTKEYVLVIDYVSSCALPHRFDLVVPAYGKLSIPGVELEDYDLGDDLGYREMDTASDHPENRWITDGKKGAVPPQWTARFDEDDGCNLALHMGDWTGGEVLTGRVPICWAPFMQERRGEELFGRYNILIWRKDLTPAKGSGELDGGLFGGMFSQHSEQNVHFGVVHEPFRGEPKIKSIRRLTLEERQARLWDPFGYPLAEGKRDWTTPRVYEIQAKDYTDYFIYIDHFIALRGGEPGRAILETSTFRVEFSGPYAYLRVADRKIRAQQGDIKTAEMVS